MYLCSSCWQADNPEDDSYTASIRDARVKHFELTAASGSKNYGNKGLPLISSVVKGLTLEGADTALREIKQTAKDIDPLVASVRASGLTTKTSSTLLGQGRSKSRTTKASNPAAKKEGGTAMVPIASTTDVEALKKDDRTLAPHLDEPTVEDVDSEESHMEGATRQGGENPWEGVPPLGEIPGFTDEEKELWMAEDLKQHLPFPVPSQIRKIGPYRYTGRSGEVMISPYDLLVAAIIHKYYESLPIIGYCYKALSVFHAAARMSIDIRCKVDPELVYPIKELTDRGLLNWCGLLGRLVFTSDELTVQSLMEVSNYDKLNRVIDEDLPGLQFHMNDVYRVVSHLVSGGSFSSLQKGEEGHCDQEVGQSRASLYRRERRMLELHQRGVDAGKGSTSCSPG